MNMEFVNSLPPEWGAYSAVFNALGDSQRQRILLLFGRNERLTIKEIVDVFPASRTAVVHHIKVLEDAGVIRRQKVGKEVHLWIDKRLLVKSIRTVANFIWERR